MKLKREERKYWYAFAEQVSGGLEAYRHEWRTSAGIWLEECHSCHRRIPASVRYLIIYTREPGTAWANQMPIRICPRCIEKRRRDGS